MKIREAKDKGVWGDYIKCAHVEMKTSEKFLTHFSDFDIPKSLCNGLVKSFQQFVQMIIWKGMQFSLIISKFWWKKKNFSEIWIKFAGCKNNEGKQNKTTLIFKLNWIIFATLRSDIFYGLWINQ